MGKGGGRGRGKGGCECCEAIHALACCLCLVLFGGPILIAVGATLIATANRNDRARGIDTVQAAVNYWNDPTSPNGWQQFQKLVAYASWTPTANCPVNASEARLVVANATPGGDRYWDEQGRFGGVQQLALTATIAYNYYVSCFMAIKVTQQLASGGANTSLIAIPAMFYTLLDYSVVLDQAGGPRNCATRNDGCGTVNARNCRSNCESHFFGQFDCNGGNFRCDISGSSFNNFAVKVAYNGSRRAYQMDITNPAAGGGANVLPAGYRRQYSIDRLPQIVPTGALFQLPNIVPKAQPIGVTFTFALRSSADPWLTYMQVTGGTGYFGVTKRSLMAAGVTLVVVGCLGTLFWLVAAFYGWWMLCSKRKPTARPAGVSGYAWDLANRYGGQYAPALGVPVHATGQDGLPTAQPLYVPPGAPYQVSGQPVAGYPPYPYPLPYGAPPPQGGPYPAYPYPAAPYPPPGGAIEMNQFSGGHPPPPPAAYGYPPPAGAAAPDGQAPYQYPYAYPYPPYGAAPPGPPPAGGAAPTAPPPSTGAGAGSTPPTGAGNGGGARS